MAKAKTLPTLARAPVRRTLATLKAAHDPATVIPNKIRAALEAMRKKDGDEGYAYEFTDNTGGTPFCKLSGVGVQQLSAFRDDFAEFIVTVKQDTGSRRGPRFVWFATKKGAKAAVEAGFDPYTPGE